MKRRHVIAEDPEELCEARDARLPRRVGTIDELDRAAKGEPAVGALHEHLEVADLGHDALKRVHDEVVVVLGVGFGRLGRASAGAAGGGASTAIVACPESATGAASVG